MQPMDRIGAESLDAAPPNMAGGQDHDSCIDCADAPHIATKNGFSGREHDVSKWPLDVPRVAPAGSL